MGHFRDESNFHHSVRRDEAGQMGQDRSTLKGQTDEYLTELAEWAVGQLRFYKERAEAWDRHVKEVQAELQYRQNLTKAQKIANGLNYLLSHGEVSTSVGHDMFYAGIVDVEKDTLIVTAHMESLGWLRADPTGEEGGYKIFA